jgi:hypothetical protein
MDMMEEAKVKQTDACVILCGAWAVWTERSARTHGESTRTMMQSVKWATDVAADLSLSGKQLTKKPLKEFQRWKPPDKTVLKIKC